MTMPSEMDVAQLLIETLDLEVKPGEINPQEPLFGDGLGLDSIDGLEVGMAIKKAYGVTVEGSDVKKVFSSLKTLQNFIIEKMEQA